MTAYMEASTILDDSALGSISLAEQRAGAGLLGAMKALPFCAGETAMLLVKAPGEQREDGPKLRVEQGIVSFPTARLAGNWSLRWLQRKPQLYPLIKRGIDVAGALILLVLLTPLALFVAVAIKLNSPGPIIFRQTRVGKGGKEFTFYKFRSMYHNSDPSIHRDYMREFINGKVPTAYSATAFKLSNDGRVTRVGKWLRTTSLDELPQLLNVLRGEMSLVGPRPAISYEVTEYKDWHRRRLEAKPGLTGLWQVHGRSTLPFDEMVKLDLDYIEKRSLWLDLVIIAKTIPAVLSMRGAR